MIVSLPYELVRSAWEDHVIQVGEHPSMDALAASTGYSRSTVGVTILELRRSGQCGGMEAAAETRRLARVRAGQTVDGRRRCICGVTMDERTIGCQRCTKRHERRRNLGGRPAVELDKRCVGCGCSLNGRTYACTPCSKRHAMRRARGEPYVPRERSVIRPKRHDGPPLEERRAA